MAARGSGEHALRHLLAPFARARHPLEGRLQARAPQRRASAARPRPPAEWACLAPARAWPVRGAPPGTPPTRAARAAGIP